MNEKAIEPMPSGKQMQIQEGTVCTYTTVVPAQEGDFSQYTSGGMPNGIVWL